MNKPEENLSQSKYVERRNVTKGYIGRDQTPLFIPDLGFSFYKS